MLQFLPLFKGDQASQTIWARAAAEEPDKAREILDYVTAKPAFQSWSKQHSDATMGKSLGNLRAMHSPRHLAGKIQEIVYDDDAKTVDVCLKVLDPTDWLKVEQGGYTGLSIGGGYAKKWPCPLNKGMTRYTPRIAEISLVDSPCIESARFLELHKRDGSIDEIKLIGHARTFAELQPPPTFSDLQKAATAEQQAKVAEVMREHKAGTLRSWRGINPKTKKPRRGPKVTDRKQAVAIALNQARRMDKSAIVEAIDARLQKADWSKAAAAARGAVHGAGEFARNSAIGAKLAYQGARAASELAGGEFGARIGGAVATRAKKLNVLAGRNKGRQIGSALGANVPAAVLTGAVGGDLAGRLASKQHDKKNLSMPNYMNKADETSGLEKINWGEAAQAARNVAGRVATGASDAYGAAQAATSHVGGELGAAIGARANQIRGGQFGTGYSAVGRFKGRAIGAKLGAKAPAAAATGVAGLAAGSALSSPSQPKKSKLAMPNYMSKRVPGHSAVELSEKQHGERIAAAKARWMKEGHHDLDKHFDAQKKKAAGAFLGRDKKVAAVEQQRHSMWSAVGDAQHAYDKVKANVPEGKDANVMIEVPHTHGLLYNPEGVGGDHFDDHGRPKKPLYMFHPAEVDDWVRTWGKNAGGKDVKKQAPSNVIGHFYELGAVGLHPSGSIREIELAKADDSKDKTSHGLKLGATAAGAVTGLGASAYLGHHVVAGARSSAAAAGHSMVANQLARHVSPGVVTSEHARAIHGHVLASTGSIPEANHAYNAVNKLRTGAASVAEKTHASALIGKYLPHLLARK